MNEWIGYIVSSFASGSLVWLATIKYTRKQAEADATSAIQKVYQEMVQDLKTERVEQRDEIMRLKETIRLQSIRIDELEKKLESYEKRYHHEADKELHAGGTDPKPKSRKSRAKQQA